MGESVTEIVPFGYLPEARITAVGRGRKDIEVSATDRGADLLVALRDLFATIEEQVEVHASDPLALVNALANLETITAGVRAVRDDVRRRAAAVLHEQRVRRLTITGVVTVEATTETKRTGWRSDDLLTECFEKSDHRILDTATGVVLNSRESAEAILAWLRPEWKLTAVRQMGINPDAHCAVLSDDDGHPVRSPSLRVIDNTTRKEWK